MNVGSITDNLSVNIIDQEEFQRGWEEIVAADSEFVSLVSAMVDSCINGKYTKIIVGKKILSLGALSAAIIGILRLRGMEGIVDVRFSEPSRLILMGPNANPTDEDLLKKEEYLQKQREMEEKAKTIGKAIELDKAKTDD